MSFKTHIKDSNYSEWDIYDLTTNNLIKLDINPIEKNSTTSERTENQEAKDNSVDLDEETNDLISSDNISMTERNELNSSENKEVDEDPRRKRRRSSAST